MEQRHNLNYLIIDDTIYETTLNRKFRSRKKYSKPDRNKINAYIPGVIQEIFVRRGQKVKEGDELLILEAMKMKNAILSPRDGIIKEIHIRTGDMVLKSQILIDFE